MTTIKTYVFIAVALVLGLGIGYISNNGATKVGGTVENYPVQFVNGLYAGTSKQYSITSSGVVTNAGELLVNGTATTTQAIGSSSIGTNKGKVCLWNGTQYSIISFAAGSTTTSVATSTSCN